MHCLPTIRSLDGLITGDRRPSQRTDIKAKCNEVSAGASLRDQKAGYSLHRENRENRENGQKKFPVRDNTGNLEILLKHREFGLLKL